MTDSTKIEEKKPIIKYDKLDDFSELFKELKSNPIIEPIIDSILDKISIDNHILKDQVFREIKKITKISIPTLNRLHRSKKSEIKTDPFTMTIFDIGSLILNHLNKNVYTLRENEEICIYKNGVYERDQGKYIRSFITNICYKKGIKFNIRLRNTVIEDIKTRTWISLKEFDKNKNIINFKNGLFYTDSWEFKEHTPDYLSFIQIPVDYIPDAKCPLIEKFLFTIFHKEDLLLIGEKTGLCLTNLTIFQKAFLLYGIGDNGKTTFLNLLRKLVGIDHVSGIDLVKLQSEYALSNLEGKLINMVSDMDISTKFSTNTFNQYVGNDLVIDVNRKFKNIYQIEPTAKLIYTCNTVFPKVHKDTDIGFYRKWIPIECPHIIKKEEVDRNILDKLTTPEELSGLLNLALLGLKRLLKRGDFESKYLQWEIVRDLWTMNTNDFHKFAKDISHIGTYKDAIKDSANQYWEKTDMTLKRFNEWRKNTGKQPISQSLLTKLVKTSTQFTLTRRRINKKQEPIYTGFQLNKKYIKDGKMIYEDASKV